MSLRGSEADEAIPMLQTGDCLAIARNDISHQLRCNHHPFLAIDLTRPCCFLQFNYLQNQQMAVELSVMVRGIPRAITDFSIAANQKGEKYGRKTSIAARSGH